MATAHDPTAPSSATAPDQPPADTPPDQPVTVPPDPAPDQPPADTPPDQPVTVPPAPSRPAAPERWDAVAHTRFAAAAEHFGALAGDVTAVVEAAQVLHACLSGGNKVLFCGNGGSAADAQHLSTELMGRFLRDRRPLPSVALTVDTSALTAIGNDYGFEQVFARQVRGLGVAGDVLVGISTSGASRNVLLAFEAAADLGITTVALTGADGGALADRADLAVRAPATATPRIQELHIAIGHTICELLEEALT